MRDFHIAQYPRSPHKIEQTPCEFYVAAMTVLWHPSGPRPTLKSFQLRIRVHTAATTTIDEALHAGTIWASVVDSGVILTIWDSKVAGVLHKPKDITLNS